MTYVRVEQSAVEVGDQQADERGEIGPLHVQARFTIGFKVVEPTGL